MNFLLENFPNNENELSKAQGRIEEGIAKYSKYVKEIFQRADAIRKNKNKLEYIVEKQQSEMDYLKNENKKLKEK